MGGRVITALIWKHFLVRKRRFIMTILEYFLPVSLFVLIYVVGRLVLMEPSSRHTKHTSDLEIQMPEPLRLSDIENTPNCIFFTPNTNFTRNLMDAVGKKLNLRKLEYFPGANSVGYFPFSNMSEISTYIASEAMKPNDAVVIFQDNNSTLFPSQLKYTIRMKTSFLTQVEASLDSRLVPHESFGTIYEPFMRLQWALDTSFIELATGNEIKQTVTLQEFPYVRRVYDGSNEIMIMLTCFAFVVGLYITFVLQVSKLVGERMNGVQELMKMSGVSSATLGVVNLLDTLPGMLVFSIAGTVMNKIGAPSILDHSNGFLLFITLLLHSFTIFAVAYVVSYTIRTEQHAQLLSILVFTVLAVFGSQMVGNLPSSWQLLVGIWPFVPMIWVTTNLFWLEKYGVGLTFGSLTSAHGECPATLWALAFMLLQTALYLLLAWYLDHVFPGKFGHAMSWDFLLQKQYWRKNDVEPGSESDESEQAQPMAPQLHFEPKPAHADVGIKVINITKVFPNHRALNNVSLDVYRGELTVLLGHNGAGKTTLMSIMTGTLKQTTGKVFVNGQDISQNQDARRQIGFCPQHNMFFPKLSVIEHVVIFSILRGQTRAQAWKSSARLLEQLGLEDKASNLCGELSGGMKRRLQLACALAGEADVLVLDEPSSGLDVETRRSLWDLILALRGSRTVLISTHFMEEADALGDRVAALHNGLLRCHASPMFLKKAMGTGYRLTLVTSGAPNEPAITSAVRTDVPDAAVKETTLNCVTYALPAASSGAFPQLFTRLEEKKVELGVESIGVGVSTLEEVFLALCSDVETSTLTQDEVDGVSSIEPTYKMTTGLRLYCRQFYELVLRQIFYVIHIKYSFLIGQVLLPVALIVLLATETKNAPDYINRTEKARTLDVASFDPQYQYRVLYRTDRDVDVQTLRHQYPKIQFEKTDDAVETMLKIGKKDLLEYHKYLAGIELNETDAKVLFTTTVRHAAPAALSLLSNALAGRVSPLSLRTSNYPLSTEADSPRAQFSMTPSKDAINTEIFVVFLAFLVLVTQVSASSLPITERISGARWMHLMAGCAPEMYWTVHLLFRLLLAVVTILVPVLIVCACDPDNTFSEPTFIAAVTVILLLGVLSFLALVFLFSFFCTQMVANFVLFVMVTINVIMAMAGAVGETGGTWRWLSAISLHTLPGHALVTALRASAARAGSNAACRLNRRLCPRLALLLPACCDSDNGNIKCYFCIEGEDGPGYYMLILSIQFVVYMGLVVVTQRGVVSWCWERLRALRAATHPAPAADDMLRAERAYVSKAIQLPTPQIPDTMLVSDVQKSFGLIRPFNAIKGISFSVKKGECLGLLGVNGAGKSSTFRVLTAEDWPTGGRVYAGRHRKGFSTEYMRRLGYCPQFFGLDNFLTGRRNLTLLLALKGLSDVDNNAETDSWIKIVGLERYSDRKVTGYSGGCQRRLAAAAALCLGAPLTLLDEPTSGVDVSARRRVWAALRRGLAHQRAVIITSHSMDEMEALCHRIAIMAAGELCALGSPSALRAAHAAGHAVVLKIRPPTPPGHKPEHSTDETDAKTTSLNQLKGTLQQTFDCTLKDEHKTMLHYHINETLPYSKLFQELERLKRAFPDYVEDYSVTETTLEEVFLSFAKGPGHPSDPEAGDQPRARARPV